MCHYNPHYTLLYSNYSLIYIYYQCIYQCSVSFLLLVINLSDLDNLLKVNLIPNSKINLFIYPFPNLAFLNLSQFLTAQLTSYLLPSAVLPEAAV